METPLADLRPKTFRTTDVECAAYLISLGWNLTQHERRSNRSIFHFSPDAAPVAEDFYDAANPYQKFAEAMRSLKQQMNEARIPRAEGGAR
jgi:hypothetical protein